MKEFQFMFWNIQNVFENKTVLHAEFAEHEKHKHKKQKTEHGTKADKDNESAAEKKSRNENLRRSKRRAEKVKENLRTVVARGFIDEEVDFTCVVELCVGVVDLRTKGYVINNEVYYDHNAAMQIMVQTNDGIDAKNSSEGKGTKRRFCYTDSPVQCNDLKFTTSDASNTHQNQRILNNPDQSSSSSSSSAGQGASAIAGMSGKPESLATTTSQSTILEFYNMFWDERKFTQVRIISPFIVDKKINPKNPFKDYNLVESGSMYEIERIRKDESGDNLKFVRRSPAWAAFVQHDDDGNPIANAIPFVVIMFHAPFNGGMDARYAAIQNLSQSDVIAACEKYDISYVIAGDFNVNYGDSHQKTKYRPLEEGSLDMNVHIGAQPTSGVNESGKKLKNCYDQIFTKNFAKATDGKVYNFAEELIPKKYDGSINWEQASRVSDHLPVLVKLTAK